MAPKAGRPRLPVRPRRRLVRRLLQTAVMQHPVAVMLDLERQPCRRAPGPDPRIHIARPPIIGRDRIRPVAVSPVEPREIGSSQKPILDQIERSPPPRSVAAAADTCIGPWGAANSGRHIAGSAPWLDSAPSTAKATRSRSAPLAAGNSSKVALLATANGSLPGHTAAEPRSTVTEDCHRSAKLTISVLPRGSRRVCCGAGVAATASTTVPPRRTCTGFIFLPAKLTTVTLPCANGADEGSVLPRTILTGGQPAIVKFDDLGVLDVLVDQRLDPSRNSRRRLDLGCAVRIGGAGGDRPCRYCSDHEEQIVTPHRRSGARSPGSLSSGGIDPCQRIRRSASIERIRSLYDCHLRTVRCRKS